MMNRGFTNTTSWRVRTFITNVALIVTIKTNNIRAFTREMRLYSWHSGAALVETNSKATSDESSKKSPQDLDIIPLNGEMHWTARQKTVKQYY